jgi:hypothetical protein
VHGLWSPEVESAWKDCQEVAVHAFEVDGMPQVTRASLNKFGGDPRSPLYIVYVRFIGKYNTRGSEGLKLTDSYSGIDSEEEDLVF